MTRSLPWRWVAGVTLPPVAARMLPVWTGIAFLVAEFWAVVDWGAVRAVLARHPVIAMVGLAAASGVSAAPLVRTSLRSPTLRPVWRSPIGRMARGSLTLIPSALAMSPAVVALALWPANAWGAALPLILMPVVGTAGLPLVAVAALHPAGAVLTPAALWLAGRALVLPEAVVRSAATTSFRPHGPVFALVTQDLLALARAGRGWVPLALAPALPLAGLAWGLRANGGLPTADRARAVGVMLCLVAPLVGAAFGDLRRSFGRRLDGPHLPVSPTQRLQALALVGFAVLTPTSAAVAAVDPGATLHPTPGLAFGSLLSGAILVLAWARPGGRRPYSMGAQLAWCLGVVALVLWDSTGARVGQALMAALAWLGADLGLRRARTAAQEGR